MIGASNSCFSTSIDDHDSLDITPDILGYSGGPWDYLSGGEYKCIISPDYSDELSVHEPGAVLPIFRGEIHGLLCLQVTSPYTPCSQHCLPALDHAGMAYMKD